MDKKSIFSCALVILVISMFVYFVSTNSNIKKDAADLDPTPKEVTLSGQYVCLPHLGEISTEECAFGLKTDSGEYYAVNFGQLADRMTDFMAGSRITAEGFTIIKEALSSDYWSKYDMKGIFTITRIIGVNSPEKKININVVCDAAVDSIIFENEYDKNKFLSNCKKGELPSVIEDYRNKLNLGNGATI